MLELSAWLLDLITKEVDYLNLDKYDDPHTSANKLALALKSPQVEVNLDFPLAKIKQGYGEAVCKVLDALTRKALEAQSLPWLRPNYPPEADIEEDDGGDIDVGETSENQEGKMNDDENGEISDEIADETIIKDGEAKGKRDEEEGFFLDRKLEKDQNKDNNGSNGASEGKANDDDEFDGNRAIVKDNGGISRAVWSEEVERVSSRLRTQHLFSSAPGSTGVILGNNPGDGGGNAVSAEWRYHLDGAKKGVETINRLKKDVKARLDLLSNDLQATIVRIEHREKSLNQEMNEELKEYASHASKLKDLETSCADVNSKVMTLTTELTSINEKVEEQKEGMGEKGSTLSDTAPLLRLRASLQQLKQEIQDLDLKAGILDQKLLSCRVKNSEKAAKEQMLKKKRGASAHSKDFDSHGHNSNSRGNTSFNRYGEVALGNRDEYSDDGAD